MRKKPIKLCLLAVCFAVLILDAKNAAEGARQGIQLCIYTVIPSIFPFMLLSSLLLSSAQHRRLFSPLARLCRIPEGSEPILLLGLVGGYPVGAKMIAESYHKGQLLRTDAERMLGFCNNAGPAFILGMAGGVLNSMPAAASLWMIHIASALLTGILIPGNSSSRVSRNSSINSNVANGMRTSIIGIASVCGWIIVYKTFLYCLSILMTYANLPLVSSLVTGILELSNGIMELSLIENPALRYVLAAIFLAFGGLCVMMQTASVAGEISLKYYIPGKLLHTAFSTLAALVLQAIIFSEAKLSFSYSLIFLGIVVLELLLCVLILKMQGRFFQNDAV